MNRFDIGRCAIACKMSHNLSSCNPPRAAIENVLYHFYNLLDGYSTSDSLSV